MKDFDWINRDSKRNRDVKQEERKALVSGR